MSKKLDQAAEDIKRGVSNATSSVAREIKKLDAPLPPVRISNDFNIEDLEKPTALILFREDYNADNKIQFNGKFRSKWTVKFNAAINLAGSLSAPQLELVDDAQINGPVNGNELQLKFKPKLFSAQLDFGHKLIHTFYNTQNDSSHLYTWFDPYLYFDSDRLFNSETLGLGVLIKTNDFSRSNTRLNLRKKENVANWDINNSFLFKHRGFFLNTALNFTYKDTLIFQTRKALLGYDKGDVNANAEVNFGSGPIQNWGVDKSSLSLSYDFRERGTLGLMGNVNLNRGKAEGAPQGAASAAEPGEDLAIAYRNKLNKNTEVKAKFSLKGLASIFLNFKVKDGLNIHTTLGTNLLNNNKKGFLELPFDFGLKVKLDQ